MQQVFRGVCVNNVNLQLSGALSEFIPLSCRVGNPRDFLDKCYSISWMENILIYALGNEAVIYEPKNGYLFTIITTQRLDKNRVYMLTYRSFFGNTFVIEIYCMLL